MNGEYEVIKEFKCHGKPMVTVRIGNAAHVMSIEEWHKVYGRNYQEKWKAKIDLDGFSPRIGYNKKAVS